MNLKNGTPTRFLRFSGYSDNAILLFNEFYIFVYNDTTYVLSISYAEQTKTDALPFIQAIMSDFFVS